MENQERNNIPNENEIFKRWEDQHNRGRKFGGFILIAVGLVWLMSRMGVEIPNWLHNGNMLLVLLGLFIGVKHKFKKLIWLVPTIIGGVGLLENALPDLSISFMLWPLLIISIGLFILFKPKNKFNENFWHKKFMKHKYQGMYWDYEKKNAEDKYTTYQEMNSDDYIDSVAVFGGVKKNIISKDFKGGSLTCFFGGTELNLSQADINGRVVLELTQVFGGTRLIIPPHWEVQSEIVAVFGSAEDKRTVKQEHIGTNKTLVLQGTVVFGGIDIKSF